MRASHAIIALLTLSWYRASEATFSVNDDVFAFPQACTECNPTSSLVLTTAV